MNSFSDIKPKEPDLNAQTRVRNLGERIHQFFPALFFAIFLGAAWMFRIFAVESVSSSANLFVLFLATLATLLVLNQRLPLQNVIALAIVIALFSGATMLVASALKVSVVPPAMNEKFRHLPAWAAPLLWTVALVNARGAAKLFLHTLRKKSNYGIALITLGSLLVASINLRAEPALKILVIQFALAFAALVVTTPWFIDKKRVERAPDFQPLVITILVMLW